MDTKTSCYLLPVTCYLLLPLRCQSVQEVGHQAIDRAKTIQIRQHLRRTLNEGAFGKVFRAVVNELLHAFPRGLQVELECGNPVAEGKGLVFAGLASGKMDGAARDLEGVAVPVERRKPIRKEAGEIGLRGLRRLFNGVPADLDTWIPQSPSHPARRQEAGPRGRCR